MSQYVSTEALTSYLGSTITADEAEIEGNAIAASNAINSWCQRSFDVADASATARVYVPRQSDVLKVHDISSTSGVIVTVDGATVAAANYQLEIAPGVPGPYGSDGRIYPWSYIRLLGSSWGCGPEATVSITAKWGWLETPAEVPLACKMLVKDYLSARDTRFGFVQIGDFSRAIATNGAVAALLAPLRGVESYGIA